LRKPNGGQGSARNLGVAKSAGNLIAFLDQDDVWYPSHLAELVRPFLRDRTLELGWAYSNLDEIDERGRMVVRAALDSVPVQHPKRDLFGCLRTDMFILPSSSLITRKAFDAVGGFDERLRGFEDDDLFLRMFRLGYDNVYTRKALSQWRVFGSSSSYSPSMAVSRMVYVRKLFEEFPDEPVRTRFWIRDILLPRFFPWMVREFTAAIQSGNQELIQTSYANLEFMARYHRRNVRLVIQLLGPVIRRPKATRLLAAVRPALQPLTRRVFR
jgi:glycosyltransferase involved in cell wall biosynthesis